LHHIGAFHDFRAQHALHGIDRFACDVFGQISRSPQAIYDLLEQRPTGQDLNFGEKGSGGALGTSSGLPSGRCPRRAAHRRRWGRGRGNLQPGGSPVCRRLHQRVGQAEREDAKKDTGKNGETVAVRCAPRRFRHTRRQNSERKISIGP